MEKKPCRDYEVQGFCVYGETCHYSHGTNPVVLDGVNAGLILTSTVSTTAITGSTNTVSTTASHGQSRNSSSSNNNNISSSSSNSNNNINNRRSGMKKRMGGGDINSLGYLLSQSRKTSDTGHHNNNNRHHHNNSNHHHHHQHQNQNSSSNNNNNNSNTNNNYRHMGASNMHRHSNNNSQHNNNDKCTLEVRRVPQHQNTIKDMNEHFSKFGTIVNLQVNYEGDPEGALIQYSSPHEAIAAYRSPEAVFNNRFIRVHWHFHKSDLSNTSDSSGQDKRFYTDEGEEIANNSSGEHQATDHKNQTTNSGSRQKGQQSTLNRLGKKRSVMMRLGTKPDNKDASSATAKLNNNQTTDDDESNDGPPAKQAHIDPDALNSPTAATNNSTMKSRRELSLNSKQQQDINNANNNKKKVQKQGVEIQRKQSDLLTNLIHQQKILIKKIEGSTEEKERASLKSILDELTQKTKDLMTKTSLKQSMIRSNHSVNQAINNSSAPATKTTTSTTTPAKTNAADDDKVDNLAADDNEGPNEDDSAQIDASVSPEQQQQSFSSCTSDLQETTAKTEGAAV